MSPKIIISFYALPKVVVDQPLKEDIFKILLDVVVVEGWAGGDDVEEEAEAGHDQPGPHQPLDFSHLVYINPWSSTT